MGLNIKNQRVHDLAREAADRTGRTQTSVIELALERLLADLDEQTRVKQPAELLTFMQDRLAGSPPLNSGDLYDAQGLPR